MKKERGRGESEEGKKGGRQAGRIIQTVIHTKVILCSGVDDAALGNISERAPCLHVTQRLNLGSGQCLLFDVFS